MSMCNEMVPDCTVLLYTLCYITLPCKNLHTLLQCHSCSVAQSCSDSQLINPVVIFVIIKTRKREGGVWSIVEQKGVTQIEYSVWASTWVVWAITALYEGFFSCNVMFEELFLITFILNKLYWQDSLVKINFAWHCSVYRIFTYVWGFLGVNPN